MSTTEMLEDVEDIEDVEAFPWQRLTGRRPGRGYIQPRPPTTTGVYVTKAEFQAAMDKVSQDVRTTAALAKTVETRLTVHSKKVDKQLDDLKKTVKSQGDMGLLIPLLMSGPARTLSAATPLKDAAGNNITSVQTGAAGGSMLPLMLILLMSGGLGSSDGKSGGFGDNSLVLLLLIMMMGRGLGG